MNLIIIVLLFILYLFQCKRVMSLEDVVIRLNNKIEVLETDVSLLNGNVQRLRDDSKEE